MIHDWEEWNEPIQELIKLMNDDYPNEFVLEITKLGAEIKLNSSIRFFASDEINKELEEQTVLKLNNEDEAKKVYEKFQEGFKEGIEEYLTIKNNSVRTQPASSELTESKDNLNPDKEMAGLIHEEFEKAKERWQKQWGFKKEP